MPVKCGSSPARALRYRPFAVALLGDVQRGVDEHLAELAVGDQRPRAVALGPERRDERDEHDQAGVGHQLGDLGHPADVLDPVGVGEAEVVVEPVPNVVAVEQRRVAAERVQPAFEQRWRSSTSPRRTGRSSRPRRAGGPSARRGPPWLTSIACQWTFCERRSAKSIIPAPTVALVSRSMRMKPPVSRLSAYGSNAVGRSVRCSRTAISLSAAWLAGVRSSVLTLMRCLRWVIVHGGGRAAELHQVRAARQQRVARASRPGGLRTGRRRRPGRRPR